MKICLIGHFSGAPDEGVKNIAINLYNWLSNDQDVLKVNISDIGKYSIVIRKFNPQIVHLIVGPSTIMSFVMSKILSFYCMNAKIIMSAPQPGHLHFKKLIPLLKPDLMLVQSQQSEELFKDLCCKTQLFFNGVDIERFVPVDMGEKNRLREKYGLEKEKFVILHVGHIKRSRGILSLKILAERNDNIVLIIGSTTTTIENDIYQELKESGCIIRVEHFRKIEEIYAMSDCYIFPTADRFSCIETPLSVLEALSCNLPVITTKFGALPRIISEGDGLIFADEEKFPEVIEGIKYGNMDINTRQKVQPYSWKNAVARLKDIYNE
jgi:glycosyltransferase involved in cell wall biosynthesis